MKLSLPRRANVLLYQRIEIRLSPVGNSSFDAGTMMSAIKNGSTALGDPKWDAVMSGDDLRNPNEVRQKLPQLKGNNSDAYIRLFNLCLQKAKSLDITTTYGHVATGLGAEPVGFWGAKYYLKYWSKVEAWMGPRFEELGQLGGTMFFGFKPGMEKYYYGKNK